MSFEETALSFWQLCHHSLTCFFPLSSNSSLCPLSSMQLLVLIGWDGGIPILKTKRRFLIGQPIIWVANCEWSGLRQQMTKNQWQASKNAGRAECSTLMKTGATILGFLCKTSYTNLAVPQGVLTLSQIQADFSRLPIEKGSPKIFPTELILKIRIGWNPP